MSRINRYRSFAVALAAASYLILPAANRGAVVINEIHYHPDVKTELAEFIELHNPGTNSVDLSGWYFSSGIDFAFPPGTTLARDSYLVLAQNTNFFKTKFGITAAGQYTGALNNTGDKLVLRNPAGQIENEVDYQSGFPWPIVGLPPGYSIELINPALDNSLGGSWRASASGTVDSSSRTLIAAGSVWAYRKGTSEASMPTDAWRQTGYDDSAWLMGPTPIGYDPTLPFGTALTDMPGNYSSIFFRTTFVVTNLSDANILFLDARYDDGFKVWINGLNVLNRNISNSEVLYDGLALSTREDSTWETSSLPPPSTFLVAGTNVIAIQLQNILLSGSSDCFLDVGLRAVSGPASHGPTPGARNSVFAANSPPQIRQVEHQPEQPVSGTTVLITAKVTDPDGVGRVTLDYQLVDPGSYIELADAAYQTNWITVAMNDSGVAGDASANDAVYSVELPALLQTHRRLVRYRITAVDLAGLSVTVPYSEDPQPNFAYFVYDGIPSWSAAIRPGSTDPVKGPVVEFGTNVMRKLPAYHLISKRSAIEQSTWGISSNGINQYNGDSYLWTGTLVFDGKVYDHIQYRSRGGVWRYAMGKNAWKIHFNQGHRFEARDNYGRLYQNPWGKMNWRPNIQQADYLHRGEQGLFEAVGYKLFNLGGTEACNTHYFQLRIIDKASETGSNQYDSDFWGIYLGVEEGDGPFLDEHGLPDGNYYMMRDGTGDLQNQGATAVSDKSDLTGFMSGYRNTAATDDWWRTNLDLARYYGFRTIVECIHDYDIDEGAGKNYLFYHNPVTDRWSIHPWDLDLTWANNMYGGGVSPFKNRVLRRTTFNLEFKNRIREIRDLLFNAEQTGKLIDEFAAFIHDPAGGLSISDADRAQWDYNPLMTNSSIVNLSKAGHGRFYQFPNEPGVPKNFSGAVQLMKNYIDSRGAWVDTNLASDPMIPDTPAVTPIGATNFPANRLIFSASAYRGSSAFAAMKWRLAEITDPNNPTFDPSQPRKYEIDADWESDELTAFTSAITIPSAIVKVGRTYRVRVRMKDDTGRWSHWASPVEFVAGQPDNSAALLEHLCISELMYQPATSSEFEFIELQNASADLTLDLNGAKFTQGIDFTFPAGTSLAPNAFLLVVKATNANDYAAFRAYYGLSSDVFIAGSYQGSLDNQGETVTLKTASGGAEIFSLKYDNGNGWPTLPDGTQLSLHRISTAQPAADLSNWFASAPTPGRADASDRDGDGLPDTWEVVHGLNLNDSSDAMLDPDRDGFNNLQEFLAGTDPRDLQSYLKLEILPSPAGWNGSLMIRFQAVSGKSYSVQYRDSILNGAWRKLADIAPVANNRLVELADTPSSGTSVRFYRLVTPGTP